MIFNNLFAKYLINNSVIDEELTNKWLMIANSNKSPIHKELSKNNILEDEVVYINLAKFLNLDFQFCQLTELNIELIKNFPKDKLIEFQAVPLNYNNNELTILTSNPFNYEELCTLSTDKIKLVITSYQQMNKIIDYITNTIQKDNVINEYSSINQKDNLKNLEKEIPIDAPIIKLCDSILKDAINRGASDIHIEPFDSIVYIRYRIDGKLQKMEDLTFSFYPALLSRFKIMAGVNIAERRIPQDGKINLVINGIQFDFRVSTIPTLHGEKIVIRIYNLSNSSNNFEQLGFSTEQIKKVLNMISRPHGIVLLTGPTGSGKSTTLYTFLKYLNKEQTNIMTVEDPVENEIIGINQIQVNPKANLTFSSALRSLLRQDPNVIMIGEIRDEETAHIATRAAITGHLVLSSIHTNDASGVITRLINMGIPKYLVADSLLGSISQRLVRKLCPKCKMAQQTKKSEEILLGLNTSQIIYVAKGCPYCNNTGYLGRIGVFEIMILDDEIKNIIMSDEFTSVKINNLLEKKGINILTNAKERVLNGETTLEEYESLIDIVR